MTQYDSSHMRYQFWFLMRVRFFNMVKKKETVYPLRRFFIISGLALGTVFTAYYILQGFQEGIFLAILLEYLFGFVIASVITWFYFIFTYKK